IIKNHVRGTQEDAHELFQGIFEASRASSLKELRQVFVSFPFAPDDKTTGTVFHQVFGSYLQDTIHCNTCGRVSSRYDFSEALSLEIVGIKKNLEAALDSYTSTEMLLGENKYYCESCKTKVEANKTLTINEAPPILPIVFKLFRGDGNKISTHITFNDTLDISPFMSAGKKNTAKRYHLYALIVHRGRTIRGGHYVTYSKGMDDKWYCFDDDQVTRTSIEQVRRQNAYMLFYAQNLATTPNNTTHPSTKRKADAAATESVPKRPCQRQPKGPKKRRRQPKGPKGIKRSLEEGESRKTKRLRGGADRGFDSDRENSEGKRTIPREKEKEVDRERERKRGRSALETEEVDRERERKRGRVVVKDEESVLRTKEVDYNREKRRDRVAKDKESDYNREKKRDRVVKDEESDYNREKRRDRVAKDEESDYDREKRRDRVVKDEESDYNREKRRDRVAKDEESDYNREKRRDRVVKDEESDYNRKRKRDRVVKDEESDNNREKRCDRVVKDEESDYNRKRKRDRVVKDEESDYNREKKRNRVVVEDEESELKTKEVDYNREKKGDKVVVKDEKSALETEEVDCKRERKCGRVVIEDNDSISDDKELSSFAEAIDDFLSEGDKEEADSNGKNNSASSNSGGESGSASSKADDDEELNNFAEVIDDFLSEGSKEGEAIDHLLSEGDKGGEELKLATIGDSLDSTSSDSDGESSSSSSDSDGESGSASSSSDDEDGIVENAKTNRRRPRSKKRWWMNRSSLPIRKNPNQHKS
ncbi:hypothetical protein BC937DRAFT_91328, partial [Endogone sp. FLAS-F59071]